MQLACPVPEGKPTLADGNRYAGGVPRPYLSDDRRRSPYEWFNHTGEPNRSAVAYPVHVARLQLGVTTVRLRADVRNRARNIPQVSPSPSPSPSLSPGPSPSPGPSLSPSPSPSPNPSPSPSPSPSPGPPPDPNPNNPSNPNNPNPNPNPEPQP